MRRCVCVRWEGPGQQAGHGGTHVLKPGTVWGVKFMTCEPMTCELFSPAGQKSEVGWNSGFGYK